MGANKIAIFGGAFDPVHNAHLAVARAAADRFQLNRVLFVASFRPPHKGCVTHAPYEDRMRMLEIACQSDPRFEASRLEEGTERSYSIDTIEKVRRGLAPGDELFFLIGADAFSELRTWHRWRDVTRAVTFIVAARPGYAYDAAPESKVEALHETLLTTSSSELRRRLAEREELMDAPPGVIEYIRLHRLYGHSRI